MLKTSFTDLLTKRGRISFGFIIQSEPASWQRAGQIDFLSLAVKGLRTNYLSVSPYCTAASIALDKINAALLKGDLSLLLAALKSSSLGLRDVKDDNVEFYAQKLIEAREMKKVRAPTVFTFECNTHRQSQQCFVGMPCRALSERPPSGSWENNNLKQKEA